MTTLLRQGLCNDRKVFPRDRFAQTRRAEVLCDKPMLHGGDVHEGIKGSMLYVWKVEPDDSET